MSDFIKAPWRLAAVIQSLVCFCLVATIGATALAEPGAAVPWTTCEAEDMAYTGTLLGPSYAGHDVASESSGRECVRLRATGQFVQFTAQSNATALVVRYSVPDTADGAGADYTLSLYTNGVLACHLPVTSRYSWLYGNYPFTNNPTLGSPRNFFDEVRTNDLSIKAGDVIKLQKDPSDTAAYYDIDLVDLENPPPPLEPPTNALNILDYGASGGGATDSTAALQNCVNAAAAQGKVAWIPSGAYLITGAINLPSGAAIQGAGMWWTQLIGSAAVYHSASRRVNLNGAGHNIHLADFAIVGRLNYRNDSEGNDGLGGSYGAGSSISRVWVEHTKTGAWILNSDGLIVDSCRFRDTLADGINLCIGMSGTIVSNCASRGTGDDCFAIWPAPGSPSYSPGRNLIVHCTGQTPFLANGGAIYGGYANQIEDCLFRDIPYQCGILLSTTFPVSTNFGGATVIEQCEINRCGGTSNSPAGALQLCLETKGISGLHLADLLITNSVTYGLSVIYGAGLLSGSVASNVDIPNCGLGDKDAPALWARSDAAGSLTVSNSLLAGYANDSSHFVFYFGPPPAQRILRVAASGGTNFTLTYATAPFSTYHLETASTLSPVSWSVVPGSVTNASGDAVTFTVPISPAGHASFYRSVSP